MPEQREELHRKPLHGKTALVTGAARRLGRASALALAGAGAAVALPFRNSGGGGGPRRWLGRRRAPTWPSLSGIRCARRKRRSWISPASAWERLRCAATLPMKPVFAR